MREEKFQFIRPLVLLASLLAFCAAGIALLTNLGQLDFSPILSSSFFPWAFLIQVVASALFIYTWKLIIIHQSNIPLGFLEATGHIGITLLGKYIPGKIWGLLGRAVLLKKKGVDLPVTANLLLLDQVLTFSSGISVSILVLAILYLNYWSIWIFLTGMVVLVLLYKAYSSITEGMLNVITKTLQRGAAKGEVISKPARAKVNPKAFYLGFFSYLAHWSLTGTALAFFVQPLIMENFFTNSLLIMVAIPAAMLSGFIALWAPGGIGVRELVIVAILSLQLPLEVATFTAITYRIVCIIIDLTIGWLAMVYFTKRGQVFS